MENVSRENFTELFQQTVEKLEISDKNLADLLDTTESTISRWKAGRNIPTRSVRKAIFSTLAN